MGAESVAWRLDGRTPFSPEPLPAGGFRWLRCGVPPSAHCPDIRRAFADLPGPGCDAGHEFPEDAVEHLTVSGLVWEALASLPRFPKSRFKTLRGSVSAGTGCVGDLKLQ